MTISDLIERKVYIKRAVIYKVWRLPSIWRILGEKTLPKMKNAKGSMVSFEDAVTEAIDIYESSLVDRGRFFDD
mgnify:CR=1 FL=1